MAIGKLTYLAIVIFIIIIVSLVWVSFPSIFPPSIKEMRNTFAISVTTPRVNAYGVNSTSFNLSFSISYNSRLLWKSSSCYWSYSIRGKSLYLSSFSPHITPSAVYSGFSSKTFVVMLLNSTVYTENRTFIVSLDAVSTPNDNWVFLSQGFNLKERQVVWIMVFEDHHVYRIGVIEFERFGECLLYMPKIERC